MKKTIALVAAALMLASAPSFAAVTSTKTVTKTVKAGNCDTHPKSAACQAASKAKK